MIAIFICARYRKNPQMWNWKYTENPLINLELEKFSIQFVTKRFPIGDEAVSTAFFVILYRFCSKEKRAFTTSEEERSAFTTSEEENSAFTALEDEKSAFTALY